MLYEWEFAGHDAGMLEKEQQANEQIDVMFD